MHFSFFLKYGICFVLFCFLEGGGGGGGGAFSLKTLLENSSPTLAVRQTVEFAGELLCVRRSRKQRDRFWPPIGHKHIFCDQS